MAFIIPNQTSTSLQRPIPKPTAWVRPADWITITDAVGEVQFLISDITNGYTAIATQYTGVGNIYISWGDGTTTTISSGAPTTTNKQYTSGGTPCSLGYNTWKIRVYGDVGTTLTDTRIVLNSNYYNFFTAASGLLEAYYGDGTQQGNFSNLFQGASSTQPYYPNLTYCKLPATITGAQSMSYAFSQCWGLRKVVMPTSAPNVNDFSFMFYFCNNLTEPIVFPQDNVGVTSMNSCFASCYWITSITLPASMPAVQAMNATFNSCWSLTSINLPEMPSCYAFAGTFGFCVNLLSLEIKSFANLPASIFNFGSFAVNCSALEYIKLPSTFPGLNANLTQAFQNCGALKNIVLPSNMIITNMTSAFSGCYSISSIVMPTATAAITTFDSAFNNCWSLQSITIPGTSVATAISFNSTFNACYSLAEITIPSSYVISLLTSTFTNCRTLQTITLPNNAQNSLTNIQNMCSGCYSLKTITMPTSMNLLATTTGAFGSCNNLTTITLPSSLPAVTSMSSVFQNCSNLQSITMPTSMAACSTFSSTFASCYRLKTLTMPSTIANSSGTFNSLVSNCYSLQSLILPTTQTTNITDISSMTDNCGSLSGITNMDKIGNTSTTSTIYVGGTTAFRNCNPTTLDFSTKFSKFDAYSSSLGNPTRLTSLRLRNTGAGQYAGTSPQINISYTSLGQAALVQVFNDLPTLAGKTINITGAAGAASLTAGERAIATGKGWTITG